MGQTAEKQAQRVDHILFGIVLGIVGLLAIFAVIAQPDGSIFQGFWAIQIGEAGLITDPIVTGGAGGALLNAAALLLLSALLVWWMRLPFTGATYACLFMMAGFALLGKNMINSTPILLGGWLYARFKREPFSKYLYLTLFGTCLAPLVSFLMLHARPGFRLLSMLLCGAAVGFLLPPVSAYTVRIHQGYNLYNVGFSAGFVGLGVTSILRGFGMDLTTRGSWGGGSHMLLCWLVAALLLGLLGSGIALGCRSFRGYCRLWRHSGRAVADFIALDGPGAAFVNMALTGGIGLAYLLALGVPLNGPLVCCILAMTGFAAFGKHPKNVLPVMAGAILSSVLMGHVPLTGPATLLATLLCTGLAPIAGQFGWAWGAAAGFIHMAIVQHTSILHGGMNLYNNGFAAGLTCILVIPIIEALKSEPKE